MRHLLPAILAAFLVPVLAGCGGGSGGPGAPIVVNSLEDLADPPAGTVTLRSALAAARSRQPVVFDVALNGGTIDLSVVGEEHTVLKGEVMGMREEPSGPVSYLVGYFDPDYGRSALYAMKDVVIDASALPDGITLAWTGGDANRARVLAVYGDLTLVNVTVTGGYSEAEDISTADPDAQPWTLARGGAVAVWGIATLRDCTLHGNHCLGDFQSSRDRGAFGGGLYADMVDLEDCVISGNTVVGGGAAGGGVYSVGGAERGRHQISRLTRCAVTGNRIRGLFAYGAGVYSDGGGIGHSYLLDLRNCTIARNLVDPPDGMPPPVLNMGYWRGGGAYMSNGSMRIRSCTIVENEVHGVPRTDSLGRRNLAGGVAATVGNAHAVDALYIGHSVLAGNVVREFSNVGVPLGSYEHDVFTGSLMHFRSQGHNRIGVIDFSQILVPVCEAGWESLSRKHYPVEDDEVGVSVADVLDLAAGIAYSATIASEGADAPGPAVLHYQPQGGALDRIGTEEYQVEEVYADLVLDGGATDDFLAILLGRIEDEYGLAGFAAAFTADFETFLTTVDADPDDPGTQSYLDPDDNPILTLADTHWFGPATTWPKELWNYPWIQFWHRLDAALEAEGIPGMGPEVLGDEAWSALFAEGPLDENDGIRIRMRTRMRTVVPATDDQLGNPRPGGFQCDIGAVEAP